MENLNAWNELSSARAESAPIRVWLVDDSESLRCLIAEFLDGEGGFECTRQFGSAEAVLEALGRETPPDVILLDVNMGAGITGLEAVRPIRAIATSTRVLILTSFSDWEGKARALRDGASDFLLKSFPLSIPDHIRLAMAKPAEACESIERAEIPGTNPLLQNRCAPETGGRSSHGVSRPYPEGCREGSWRYTSSRLVRGVHYLRALFRWGGRPANPQSGMTSISE